MNSTDVQSVELPAGAPRRVLFTAEHHGAAVATFDEKLASRAAYLGVAVTTAPMTG